MAFSVFSCPEYGANVRGDYFRVFTSPPLLFSAKIGRMDAKLKKNSLYFNPRRKPQVRPKVIFLDNIIIVNSIIGVSKKNI